MQMSIKAPQDAIIDEICVKEGGFFDSGQALFECKLQNPLKGKKSFKMAVTQHIGISRYTILRSIEESKARQRELKEYLVATENLQLREGTKSSPADLVAQLTLAEGAEKYTERSDVIHVVGNRAGCAAKIIGDLIRSGVDPANIYLLRTDGDKTTPIGKNFPNIKLVTNYKDQEQILGILENLAKTNKDKKIEFHSGWGFLSEKDDFVAKIEKLNLVKLR